MPEMSEGIEFTGTGPMPNPDQQERVRVLESDADYEEGVRCVVMRCCGFTFDANHFDDVPGEARYSCPSCQQTAAEQEVKRLREELERAHKAMRDWSDIALEDK